MKFFIFVIAMIVSCASWAADDAQLQKDRAKAGFELFKNICFMMSPKESWKPREEFLDKNFKRHDGDKKKIFMDMMRAESGEVWAAIFSEGVFAVVVETNGNCHVVAHKADDDTLHAEMKTLSKEAKKNLEGVEIVSAPPFEQDGRKTSAFEIKAGKDGPVVTAVVLTTLENPPENKPAALMTVAVAARATKK